MIDHRAPAQTPRKEVPSAAREFLSWLALVGGVLLVGLGAAMVAQAGPLLAVVGLCGIALAVRGLVREGRRRSSGVATASFLPHEADPFGDRRVIARAIVLGAAIISATALAVTGAWVLEYADAHTQGFYSGGAIAYLFVGALLVVIGLIAALVYFRSPSR